MTSLERQDWMEEASTQAVMAALEAVRPGSARFVGGCVRNAIMGAPVDDIDIATQLEPDAVIAALEAASIKAIPTGIDHGTITAVTDGKPFEITTLRRDVETDGRRAVVAFTEDWAEDAARRDFRLNALYAEMDGTLHDPTGGGLGDAETGSVIFIGEADQRLKEDYLRILRFFRFNAWYGAGIDLDGLAACKRQREGLSRIARERIWKELHKLLGAPDPGDAVSAMYACKVMHMILPQTAGVDGLHDLHVSEMMCGAAPDPMLRLMALIPRTADSVMATSEALRLSNAETDRLKAWAADNVPDVTSFNGRSLRHALYWHGKQVIADHALLSGADVRDLLAAIRLWKRPEFPLNGEDALAAGLKGKAIGDTLRRLEEQWMDEDFQPGRDELLARLKSPS
jgi:poly(A) polymerase